jgi:opacity protein-like surface antigen
MNEARTRRTARLAPLALGLLVLSALPAAAQDRSGSWEITPNAGGYFGGRIYDSVPPPGGVRYHFSLGNAPTYGGRIGYNINRWLGVEVGYAYANPNTRSDGPPATSLGRVKLNMFDVGGIFNLARGPVIPYLTLGAGGTNFSPDVTRGSSTSDTRFSTTLGGGIKFFFTPHVALRIDGRYRATFTDRDIHHTVSCGSNNNSTCYSYTNQWASSGSATGGLTFAF